MLNLGGRWGWVVIATTRLLYPLERDPVPMVQEANPASAPQGYVEMVTGVRGCPEGGLL
jgi:hypothetical protein